MLHRWDLGRPRTNEKCRRP